MNEINQLNKAYRKRFKQLNKHILATKNAGLDVVASDVGLAIFVDHLKYLRDVYIVTQQSTNSITTLNAAIEEFNAYQKTQKEFHWQM